MNKTVPINQGNYEIDTQERIDKFNKNLSYGWEEKYIEYRKNWVELPKKQIIRDYPLLVDLELADVCNLKCPMCITITDQFRDGKVRGFMSTKLAKKIIDEVAGKIYSLRLSWAGESTLHKDLFEIIRYAKQQGIKETSLLTNGAKLNLDYFQKLVEAGIDWITISIDGLDEEYEKIRKPLKFKDTLKKLQDIKEYKTKHNLNKPVIKVQGLWSAMKNNPAKYYNTLAPYVDLIAYNPLITYNDKEPIEYVNNFSCPQLYQRLVVSSQGKVCFCTNDDFAQHPIGDANIQSIYEIWHGDLLNDIRKKHLNNQFLCVDVCSKGCYVPRKMVETETCTINGRHITILDYKR